MNCKPGDLAVIVSQDPANPHLVGTLVNVLGEHPRPSKFQQWWWCEHVGRRLVMLNGLPTIEFGCPDFALRPIRPGEEPEVINTDEPLEVPA